MNKENDINLGLLFLPIIVILVVVATVFFTATDRIEVEIINDNNNNNNIITPNSNIGDSDNLGNNNKDEYGRCDFFLSGDIKVFCYDNEKIILAHQFHNVSMCYDMEKTENVELCKKVMLYQFISDLEQISYYEAETEIEKEEIDRDNIAFNNDYNLFEKNVEDYCREYSNNLNINCYDLVLFDKTFNLDKTDISCHYFIQQENYDSCVKLQSKITFTQNETVYCDEMSDIFVSKCFNYINPEE